MVKKFVADNARSADRHSECGDPHGFEGRVPGMKRATVELEVRWDKIQNFRFVLQLADHLDVILRRAAPAEAIVREFPGSAVRLADRLKRPESFETIHDRSPYMACRIRGFEIKGPFFSHEMLDRIQHGPKTKKFSFWGHPHPWRAQELAPWLEHCRWRPRAEVSKVWDAAYFEELARTEFAICPTGQNRWLYRPAEAVAAFAIPANTPQQAAKAPPSCYHEVLLEAGRTFEYSAQIAARNFELLVEEMAREWEPFLHSLR
jgi:hypothetical protein